MSTTTEVTETFSIPTRTLGSSTPVGSVEQRLSKEFIIPIKSSSLIKSPVIAIPCRKHGSTSHRNKRLRLAAEECQISRKRMLHHLSQQRLVAEQEHAAKEHQEIMALIQADQLGKSCGNLDAGSALHFAKVTREVLFAERRVAELRVLECQMLLETLQDAEEQAHVSWGYAHDQVSAILRIFQKKDIAVKQPSYPLVPPPLISHRHTLKSIVSDASSSHRSESPLGSESDSNSTSDTEWSSMSLIEKSADL